jgi:hypothetical protein
MREISSRISARFAGVHPGYRLQTNKKPAPDGAG